MWKRTVRQLHLIYNDIYDRGEYLESHLKTDDAPTAPARAYLTRLIPAQGNGRKLLEIGPGAGYSLAFFRDRGYSVEGVDVSAKLSHSIQQRFGIKVFVGMIEDLAARWTNECAVVIATHVIEHVPDPRSFIRALRACLAPGGELIIATPNCNCLMAKVTRGRYWTYQVSDHVSFFTGESLCSLLDGEGFDVVRMETSGTDVAHSLSQLVQNRAGVRREAEQIAPPPQQPSLRARTRIALRRGVDGPFWWLGSAGLGYELVAKAVVRSGERQCSR